MVHSWSEVLGQHLHDHLQLLHDLHRSPVVQHSPQLHWNWRIVSIFLFDLFAENNFHCDFCARNSWQSLQSDIVEYNTSNKFKFLILDSSFSLQFPPEICQIVGLEPGWPSAVATDRNSCTQHSSIFCCIILCRFFWNFKDIKNSWKILNFFSRWEIQKNFLKSFKNI